MVKKKNPDVSRRRGLSPAPVPSSSSPTLIMNGAPAPGATREPTWREAMDELQNVIDARFEALGERVALLEDESCERARAEGKAP